MKYLKVVFKACLKRFFLALTIFYIVEIQIHTPFWLVTFKFLKCAGSIYVQEAFYRNH